jgi:hypothetical protein
MHFGIDVRDSDLAAHKDVLQAMKMKWVLFYVGDALQAQRCAVMAASIGAEPIIRPKTKIGELGQWESIVTAVANVIKHKPYIQLFNEPGNSGEWKSGHYNLDQLVGEWGNAARRVTDAGGLPGLQSMDEGEIKAILANVPADVSASMWFASHAYCSNHPPMYPADKGLTIFQDDTCCRRWREEGEWVKQTLGFYVPTIVTEGGPVFDQQEDMTYPRVNAQMFANWMVEIYGWFKTGSISGVEPLPDWFFAYCPFLLFDYGGFQSFAWESQVPNVISAVSAIPAFVRKFSWDVPPLPSGCRSLIKRLTEGFHV